MIVRASDVSRCRSCGAPILWAFTDRGKRMPVDAHPHPEGRLDLARRDDGEIEVEVREPTTARMRHRPHFATCPDADSWRRR